MWLVAGCCCQNFSSSESISEESVVQTVGTISCAFGNAIQIDIKGTK